MREWAPRGTLGPPPTRLRARRNTSPTLPEIPVARTDDGIPVIVGDDDEDCAETTLMGNPSGICKLSGDPDEDADETLLMGKSGEVPSIGGDDEDDADIDETKLMPKNSDVRELKASDDASEIGETLVYAKPPVAPPPPRVKKETVPSLRSLIDEEEKVAKQEAPREELVEEEPPPSAIVVAKPKKEEPDVDLDALVAAYEVRATKLEKDRAHAAHIVAQAMLSEVDEDERASSKKKAKRKPHASAAMAPTSKLKHVWQHHGYKIIFSVLCLWGMIELVLVR